MDNEWLKHQKAYQEFVYAVDYTEMWKNGEVISYVTTMLNAASIEVAEAQQEVPWKPWAQLTTEQRVQRLHDQRGKVAGEVVDVMFFLVNTLVALGVTDQQLESMYAAKMGVNKERQLNNYDAISTKCAKCGRALDEPGAAPPIVSDVDGKQYCGYICEADVHGLTTRVRCTKCGYVIGPFDLQVTGLDDKVYCGTQHAIEASGGQKDDD